MTGPRACVAEHLIVDDEGNLTLAPWSVPRNVLDEIAPSSGDTTKLLATESLERARMLVNWRGAWLNDTPVAHMARITVTRRYRRWVVSNPNAVQFRDRWSSAIDGEPVTPVVSGIFNSQTGSAGDIGTNTVAEPNPGVFHHWWGTNTSEEWVGPVEPGSTLNIAYRAYVWTPPPFSNNANKNVPKHEAEAGFARVAVLAVPEPSQVVVG